MRELNSQFGSVAGLAAPCDFRARKQSPVYSEVFRITLSLIIIIIMHHLYYERRPYKPESPYAASELLTWVR